jgi:hypothetical protein
LLQNALAEASREKGIARFVKGVVMTKKKSLWGYQFDQEHPFIQVCPLRRHPLVLPPSFRIFSLAPSFSVP